MSVGASVRTFGEMIRFSHTIFALPFALASMLLAASGRGLRASQLLWILAAMVGARTAAMAFNRLADHDLDAENARTRGRALPQGKLTRAQVWAAVVIGSALLVIAAYALNPLCFALSPVALVVVLGYSYTKRFTALTHLVLGLCLAIAPVGAWLAIRGRFDAPPLLLALGVLFWVAGFDIIYACQDVDFDRGHGVRSIPARLGVAGALRVSRAMHVASWLVVASVGVLLRLGVVYWATMLVVGALFVRQHWIVRGGRLERADLAFFTMNGWLSIVYLAGVAGALALSPSTR
jgi:4-hydroxybenzoate polyprenyltransferase